MIIYCITNLINGKRYVGQTIHRSIKPRLKRHFCNAPSKRKSCIHDAIMKYGKNNFKCEILNNMSNSQEELDLLEQKYILDLNTLVPNGYNMRTGGRGGNKLIDPSAIAKHKENVSKALKGKFRTDEQKLNMSKARKGFDSENRKKARELNFSNKRKNGEFIRLKAIHLESNKEYKFDTISECALSLNLESSCVSRVCRGKNGRRQHKGYIFIAEKYQGSELPKKRLNPMEGIQKINRGGYSLRLKNKYIGYKQTLEEIIKLKELSLKSSKTKVENLIRKNYRSLNQKK